MKKRFLRALSLALVVFMLLSTAACSAPQLPSDSETEEIPNTVSTTETVAEQEDDGIFNVLLIGSSFAYRFPDELCAMAEEMGVSMRVYHAYASGLTLATQWNWFRADTGDYTPNLHKTSDIKEMRSPTGKRIVDYLSLYDWDVISVHQTPMGFRTGDVEECRQGCIYAKAFYEFLRERCPDARYMWYQIWGINVGYTAEDPEKCIPDRQKQLAMHNASHTVAREMASQHKVDLVPAGDAWEIIRSETQIGDRLTGTEEKEYGDNLHDGDVGGGQYLNACVWFEVLFQKSCVGSTWRPESYSLEEAKIPLLQDAAHRAVAAYWGEDYAK